MASPAAPHVALFVTCLVELYRPAVADAAQTLLERGGARVSVPRGQTCCGQPVYNAGDRADAKALARHMITAFESFDAVVAPSGSCAATVKRHYPDLLADEPAWAERARALAEKTYELTAYLSDVLGANLGGAAGGASISYHDGCSGLRELGVKAAPRRLLGQVDGLELCEMKEPERCCGFGGLFCVKYDAISAAMGGRKLDGAEATGAEELVAGELGCLLHLAGLAHRQGRRLRCRHVAETLAGLDGMPAIGDD